jgi:YD repeat-containing protein
MRLISLDVRIWPKGGQVSRSRGAQTNGVRSKRRWSSTTIGSIGLPFIAVFVFSGPSGAAPHRALQGNSALAIVQPVSELPNGAALDLDRFGPWRASVKLEVPEYRGVTPAAALVYSSSGGNGVFGFGWRLDGVPSIERMSATRGQPDFKGTDRFFQDGAELLGCDGRLKPTAPSCVAGGNYGFEDETFQKVLFDDLLWRIRTTTGTEMRFDADPTPQGQRVWRWHLTEVRDRNGNRASYTWRHRDGEAYLQTIEYGFSGGGIAQYRIELEYETRPDILSRASPTGLVLTRERVVSIAVTSFGQLARAYNLHYETRTDTAGSFLRSIEQLDANAVKQPSGRWAGDKLPATKYERAEALPAPLGPWSRGDELEEAAAKPTYRAGTRSSFSWTVSGSFPAKTHFTWTTPTSNRDGIPDLAIQAKSSLTSTAPPPALDLRVADGPYEFATPATPLAPTSVTASVTAGATVYRPDLDGDGLADFVSVTGQEVTVGRGRSTGGLEFRPAMMIAELPTREGRYLWGDFDGDERPDLLAYSRRSSALQMPGSTSAPCTLTNAWECDLARDRFALLRFGLDGAISVESLTVPVGVTFADRFTRLDVPFPFPSWRPSGYESVLPLPEWTTADLDGDGVQELVLLRALPDPASGTTHVRLQITPHFLIEEANGTLAAAKSSTATIANYALINGTLDAQLGLNLFGDPGDLSGRLLWGEFDGDGRADFLLQQPYKTSDPSNQPIVALSLAAYYSQGDGTFNTGPVARTLEPASFIGSWRSAVVSISEHPVLGRMWVPIFCNVNQCRAENRAFEDGHTLFVNDFDGDGIDDLFLSEEGTEATWAPFPTALSSPITTRTLLWGPGGIASTRGSVATGRTASFEVFTQAGRAKVEARFAWLTGDFNADSVTDVALADFRTASGATIRVFPSEPRADTPRAAQWVDVTGEGIADLVRVGAYQSEIPSILRTRAQFRPFVAPVSTGRANQLLVGDFGGPNDARADGRIDFAWLSPAGGVFPATSASLSVLLSNGDGTFSSQSPPVNGVDYVSDRWFVTDLDGDRVDDIVQVESGDSETRIRAIQRTGTSTWTGSTTPALPLGTAFLGAARWQPAQVAGGERADLIRLLPFGRDAQSALTADLLIQRPSGWSPDTADLPAAGVSPRTTHLGKFRLADVNGDGLSDLLRISRTRDFAPDVRVMTQFVSTGLGSPRFAHERFEATAPAGAVTADAEAAGSSWRLADVDGDGFEDAVQVARGRLTGPESFFDFVHVLHRNGVSDATWERHRVAGSRRPDVASWSLLDWDANGVTDLVRPIPADAAGSLSAENYPSDHATPRIVREENGYGLVTEVSYASSKGHHIGVPAGMHETSVSRIERLVLPSKDRSRIDLSYEGFRYDHVRKRLAGWEQGTSRNAHFTNAAAMPVLQVTNAQDPACTGRRLEERRPDEFKTIEYLRSLAHGNYRCLVAAEIEGEVFPPGGGSLLRRNRYAYDDWGNASDVWADGRFDDWNRDGGDDLPDDNRRTHVDFDYNLGAYLVAFPRETRRYDSGGALFAKQRFAYDGQSVGAAPVRGDLTGQEEWDDDGARWIAKTSTYRPNGAVWTTTGATGVTHTTTYDPVLEAYPEQLCDPKHCTKTFWDKRLSEVEKTIDANGETTRNEYDSFGRLRRTIFHDGGCLMHHFGDLGDPTKQWSFEGVCTRPNEEFDLGRSLGIVTQFDGLMRPWRQSRNATYERLLTHWGTTSLQRSTERWRRIGSTAALTETYHDVRGRVVRVVNPDGTERRAGHWPGVTATEDENGNVREAERDAFGNVVTAREWYYDGRAWVAYEAHYHYDAGDRLVRTVDALGNVSTGDYNSLGWPIRSCDPDRGCIEYDYYDDGQPRTITDARGAAQELTYDALGRLEARQTTRNGTTVDLERRYWDVDPATNHPRGFSLGRVVRIEDKSGSEELTYDTRGRATRKERCTTASGQTTCNEWALGFDLTGSLATTTYPDATGKVSASSEVVTNDFDAFGRVRRVHSPLAVYLADAEYDPADLPTRLELGNGVVETTVYHPKRSWLEKREVVAVKGDGLLLE